MIHLCIWLMMMKKVMLITSMKMKIKKVMLIASIKMKMKKLIRMTE